MSIIETIIKKPLESFWSNIESEVSQVMQNRLLEYQTEEYNRNFYTKTILHRTEPVKLLDFYQPLFIRPIGRNNADQRIPTFSAKLLFGRSNCITILGTAGSGKSTIVKYLITKTIEEEFRIPVKIELRYLNEYEDSLHSYIINEVFKFSKISIDEKITNRLLHSGKFLFFFDGYDELSSDKKEQTTKEINDFTKLYTNNCYLLTSRPYTNIELLSKFSNYEVCELSEDEIIEFVRKQIPHSEKEIADKIIEVISKEKDGSYQTFLSIPLLLSMFVLTFQTYSNIPPKKSAFYKQVFDSLFYLHDSMSKLAYSREKISELNKEEFEEVLKIFSFISYFQEVFIFSEEYISKKMNQIKEKKKHLEFENQAILTDLQVAICIFQKEGLDYSFPHRSLQEYFASIYLSQLEQKNKMVVYNKLLQQFKDFDIFELISRDNFFSLLIEQDNSGIIRNMSIPFLEFVQIELRNEHADTTSAFGSLRFFVGCFHIEDEEFEKIIEIVDNFMQGRMDIISAAREKDAKVIQLSLESEQELKELGLLNGKLLRQELSKVVKALRTKLKDITTSDGDIIDMI